MGQVVFNIEYTPAKAPKRASKEAIKEWSDTRQFYNLTAGYNYITYSLNGLKTQTHKDYLDYMEKSTGAFDQEGFIDGERLEKIKKELAKTESTIWHGFISFDEETSPKFDNVDECIHFLKRTFSSLTKGSALKLDNLEIMASLHRDTDHRHIHFMFYEKQPTHLSRDGSLSYTTKNVFNQANIDNFMIEANLYLDENKADLYSSRNEVMKLLKTNLGAVIKSDYGESEIGKRLYNLAQKLPKTGRLQYGSDNILNLHDEIDNIVSCVIKSDNNLFNAVSDINKALSRREALINKIRKDNKIAWVEGKKIKPSEINEDSFIQPGTISDGKINDELKYIADLRKDMKRRLGNVVLASAKELINTKEIETTKLDWSVNSRHHKVAARQLRQIIDKVCYKFVRNIGREVYGIQEDFSNKLHSAEHEIERERKDY